MKVMISQPMNGLDEKEVEKLRLEIATKFNQAGDEIAYSLFKFKEEGYKTPALQYLGASIHIMSTVDAVYFAPGWEEARGCVIERKVCEAYGIKILDEIPAPLLMPENTDDALSGDDSQIINKEENK